MVWHEEGGQMWSFQKQQKICSLMVNKRFFLGAPNLTMEICTDSYAVGTSCDDFCSRVPKLFYLHSRSRVWCGMALNIHTSICKYLFSTLNMIFSVWYAKYEHMH